MKARKQAMYGMAAHREFMLNVAAANPMGDFPSGKSCGHLSVFVCDNVRRKIPGAASDGMGAVEDDDTDAADVAAVTAASTGAMVASSLVSGVDVD